MVFFLIYLFCYSGILVVTGRIYFPDQGLNPGSLHWELRVLASGPPGKFLIKLILWLKLFHRQKATEDMLGKDHRILLHFTRTLHLSFLPTSLLASMYLQPVYRGEPQSTILRPFCFVYTH